MATKKDYQDPMTFTVPPKEEEMEEQMVTVFLPRLEEGSGMKVDQYEHVTIANEKGEKCYKVLRGERVDVPVSVYLVLKEKYPEI